MGGETVTSKRRRHGAKFKARVVLQALKGEKSTNDLAGLYQVHPSQIAAWKKRAVEGLPELFSNHRAKDEKAEQVLKAQLYQEVGQLKVELDWHSRYVVSWEVSASLEAEFCVGALEAALALTQPEIFNTDQGVQFTSEAFTERLECERIAISRDGRGRVFDNIFSERLWRTVKYEEVYLKDYQDLAEARRNLRNYFAFYNRERLHQARRYATPEAVYLGKNLVAVSGEQGALKEGCAAATPVALRALSVTAAGSAKLS